MSPTAEAGRPSGRRSFGLLAGLLVALAAILAWKWFREPSSGSRLAWRQQITDEHRASRPDILLVVYDARRGDDFSFGPLGNRRGDTPFLAELQRDAIVFGRAIAPGTWTIPVHASMFTGLSGCDLGIDHYNPGFAALSPDVLTLAEILTLSGYQTIASADHPFFFNARYDLSLVRGFRSIDVVTDFSSFELVSNMGTPGGETTRRRPLEGLPDIGREELVGRIEAFNRGEGSFETASWDHDAATDVHLADLQPFYARSPYFDRRYGSTLAQGLPGEDRDAPYFLFVNLHMSTVANPDPYLLSRWSLETLMGNARRRGATLVAGPEDAAPAEVIRLNFARLGLSAGAFEDGALYLKHVFDTRLYDATFRALWELLERRGLTRRVLTVVTSDHGLSLSERGEELYLHEGARPHEYITRVPLVVRYPEGSPECELHGFREEAVSLVDLFPTLVEAGVGRGVFERRLPLRGRSLPVRIRSGAFEPVLVSESSLLPSGYRREPGLIGYAKAVYSGRDKLIYVPDPVRIDGLWPNTWRLGETPTGPDPAEPPPTEALGEPWAEVYDLESDPLERENLAEVRADRVREMATRLRGHWECSPIVSSTEALEWSAESLETIRSLGYVQ